jgi:hypothetical protein
MKKIQLHLHSTEVLGNFSIVNISVNDLLVLEKLQLARQSQILEFPINSNTDSTVIKIDILNDQAYDSDSKDYSSPNAQIMSVLITKVQIGQKKLFPDGYMAPFFGNTDRSIVSLIKIDHKIKKDHSIKNNHWTIYKKGYIVFANLLR